MKRMSRECTHLPGTEKQHPEFYSAWQQLQFDMLITHLDGIDVGSSKPTTSLLTVFMWTAILLDDNAVYVYGTSCQMLYSMAEG